MGDLIEVEFLIEPTWESYGPEGNPVPATSPIRDYFSRHALKVPNAEMATGQRFTQLESSGALFIPNVLEHIFSYLDLGTLLNCGQVCSQWDDEVARAISKTVILEIAFDSTNTPEKNATARSKIPWDTRKNHTIFSSTFEDLLAMQARKENVLFSKYSLQPTRDCFKLAQYFEIFGQTVRHLEISVLRPTDMADFVQKICQFCPQLDSLYVRSGRNPNPAWWEIQEDGQSEEDVESGQPIIFDNSKVKNINVRYLQITGDLTESECSIMFKVTPKLREIEVRSADKSKTMTDDAVFSALQKAGRLTTLEAICTDELTHSSFQLLKDLGKQLSLQKFGFNALSPSVKIPQLEAFVRSQCKTLTHLSLGHVATPDHENRVELATFEDDRTRCPGMPLQLHLDKMEALTDLKMSIDSRFFIPYIYGPSSKFLKNPNDFPKLRRIRIPLVCSLEHIPHHVPHPTVTDLTIGVSYGYNKWRGNPYTWLTIGKLFPATESLTLLYARNNDIRHASEAWPCLKNLALKFKKYFGSVENLESWEEILATFPDIGGFRRLETLSVYEDVVNDRLKFLGVDDFFEPRLFCNFL